MLQSPLIGRVRILVDHVAGVRFLARLAKVAEPPDLRSDKRTISCPCALPTSIASAATRTQTRRVSSRRRTSAEP